MQLDLHQRSWPPSPFLRRAGTPMCQHYATAATTPDCVRVGQMGGGAALGAQ